MPLLELRSVCFAYGSPSGPGEGNALKNINLSVERGEYLAIAGANGSGKSTLLRLMAGLLKPDSGTVRFDESDTAVSTTPGSGKTAGRKGLKVGLVFQSPADQIVSSVVEDDVAFGCENLGLSPGEIGPRIESSLSAVGLLAERYKPTRFLSAGQQQRLAIAGVLAMRPDCIAFDEATAMLDPEARSDVLSILDRLAADGIAVIHVTHNMSEVTRAKRLVVLGSGELLYDGKTFDFFTMQDPDRYGLEFPEEVLIARALGLEPLPGESAEALAMRIRNARSSALSGSSGSSSLSAGTHPEQAEPAEMTEPAFRLSDVSFSWLKGTLNENPAVRDVDFSVPRGGFVALAGRTGSGKSSVLQLLNALNRPDSGTVISLGTDTTTGVPADRASPGDIPSASDSATPAPNVSAGPMRKGFRFFRKKKTSSGEDAIRRLRLRAPMAIQRPESALFEFHAGDDVAFGPRNLGLAGKGLVARVAFWMESFGLPFEGFRDRQTRALSGGEKRKLALAGVFAMESEAVLLDEPGSALDPVTRRSVMNLLEGFVRLPGANRIGRTGRTIVMITHSMDEAARADLVGVFSEGRLVAFDNPGRVFGSLYDPSWGIARPFAAQVASSAGIAMPDGGLLLDLGDLVSAISGGGSDARH